MKIKHLELFLSERNTFLCSLPCSPLRIEIISKDLFGASSEVLASALSGLDAISGDIPTWNGGFDERRNLNAFGEYFSSLSALF